jgi:glyoxylase-like metal-dependent hydrolase (beta-lactamase superfamily II)
MLEPRLSEIVTRPFFGIGGRAFVIQTEAGNVIWDCLGYFDDRTRATVRDLGGVAAIACSHPHFYGSMVEWSDAFGGAPIYICEDDARWIRRTTSAIRFWTGRRDILPGITLIQCGGHFDGSGVLHWQDGADGLGALLVTDTISVAQDGRTVGFMRSNPNWIPLGRRGAERIAGSVRDLAFTRMYGGFPGMVIREGADAAVQRSLQRHLTWIH